MSSSNLIIIYTGNGKGKTSAALGLALRSLRDNKKVLLIQFIKSNKQSGEVSLKKILPKLQIKCFGQGFVYKSQSVKGSRVKDKEITKKGVEFTKKAIKSQKYDVIVLDEVLIAIHLKLIPINVIIDLIKQTRQLGRTFLVLTGRGCPKSLYAQADLVTEMKEIKHPFSKGISAIKGIDY